MLSLLPVELTKSAAPDCGLFILWLSKLGPVVQNILSLTISLKHKFVKQISVKITNTLLFLLKKCDSVFVSLADICLTNLCLNDIVKLTML